MSKVLEQLKQMVLEAKGEGADPAEADAILEDLREWVEGEVSRALAPLEERYTTHLKDFQKSVHDGKQRKFIPGQTAARCVQAFIHGGKNLQGALELAQKRWPNDEAVAKTLTGSSSSGGGFLISGDPAGELIELLRAQSVVRTMSPVFQPMNTDTKPVPGISGGATSAYIGENTSQTASDLTFRQFVLRAKKLRATVAMSNELNDDADDATDQIVIDDIASSMAVTEDTKFIRGDGLESNPKGLRYWANSTTASAGANDGSDPTLDEVRTDIQAAIDALTGANVRMLRPGWLMSHRTRNYMMWRLTDGNNNLVFNSELSGGMLADYPVGVTNNIPDNLASGTAGESELYLADFADVVIGDRKMIEFAVSSEASFTDSGGSTVSAFDNDLVVVRAISRNDLVARHAESIHVITGIVYGG